MKQLNELQAKGAHGTCPTVKVKADNEQGFTEINEHDFDSDVHEKYVEPKKAKKPDADEIDWSKKTKADIVKHLDSLGIAHDAAGTKDELIALIPQ